MKRCLWKVMMWLWCREAKRLYGGTGERGEAFNTASFRHVVGKTTGQTPGEQTSKMWLVSFGMFPGYGGCHWFCSSDAADATFPQTKITIGDIA